MKTLKKNNLLIVILFLIAVIMSVGFAIISTTLNINGQAVIKANTWDIHFENLKIINGSVTALSDAKIVDESSTKVEYSIVLENPGDYYEFTVDAVNSGSGDSMIEVLSLSGLEGHENYLNCKVTYLDGTEIKVYDALNSKERKTYKVRVEYKTNMQGLPAEDQRINFSFSVIYSQSENGEFVDPMCPYEEGTTWEFTYTGGIQEFAVSCNGTYKLEVWGAQGGDGYGKSKESEVYSMAGGKGGYSFGFVSLLKDNNLYVVVGGTGQDRVYSGTGVGGYNGGGTASGFTSAYGNSGSGGTGGGATHIGTFNSTLADHGTTSGLYIVAGGGGGAYARGHTTSGGWTYVGGVGGGLNGGPNTEYGATQTSGNAFGLGGSSSSESGGGGGGLYGGLTATYRTAGGGSGYIDGVNDGETIAGDSEMPTHDGTSTMTGNEGNGHAKITLISLN